MLVAIKVFGFLLAGYSCIAMTKLVPPFQNWGQAFIGAAFGFLIYYGASSGMVEALLTDLPEEQHSTAMAASMSPGAWRGNISQSNWPEEAKQANLALLDHHILKNRSSGMPVQCPRRLVRGVVYVICFPDNAYYILTNVRGPVLIMPLNGPAKQSVRGVAYLPDSRMDPVLVMRPDHALYQSIYDAIPFREVENAFLSN